MKKKVKKIPKYNSGGTISPDVLNKAMNGRFITPNVGSNASKPMATLVQHQKAIGGGAGNSGSRINLPGGMATASNALLMNTIGIDDNSKEGVMLNSTAQGADIGGSIMPGWGHLIGGAAGALVGSFKQGSVDPNTGEITYGGIFGKSTRSLQMESNRIKNAIQAKAQTQNLQANYYNNPNVVQNANVLAAEGGVVPGEHYASRGEVEVSADGTNAVRYGWDPKGKDTYHVYTNPDGSPAIGNMVFTEEGVKRPNGEKYSDAAEKIINGTKEGSKLRQISLRKLANEMEEQKMGKQIKKMKNGIPAHEGGYNGRTSYTGISHYRKERKLEQLKAVEWNGRTGYFDIEGDFHELPPNPALWPDSVYRGDYKNVPVMYTVGKGNTAATENKSVVPTFVPDEIQVNGVKSSDTSTKTKSTTSTKSPTQDQINAFYGYDREKVITAQRKDRNKRINSKNRKYVTDEDLNGGELDEVVVTAPRLNKRTPNKDSNKRNSSSKTTPVVNQMGLDWARQEAARAMSQYAPNTTKMVAPGLVSPKIDPTEIVDEAALPSPSVIGNQGSTGTNSSGSNWRDGLYRMAVLSQPLWDRAEAEPIDWTSPIYKYMPTQIDVTSQLRDADQSYALAKYNFANLYPNTGAGMAAGLQAAANRSKQYADIRQYQTNAQNELIGKNVGIYNNWANEHARILNDVYNKTAANRAAARNINRQNRAAALSNYGQMLRDDKQYAMDTLKINMLEPLLAYGTENSDIIVKKARNILSGNYGKPV